MKATIVAAGGFTGGIFSTIAGGKFIDGFKQGLITAGLNHVDPKAKSDFSKEAVTDLTVRDGNLKQMYKNADYPSLSLAANQAEAG